MAFDSYRPTHYWKYEIIQEMTASQTSDNNNLSLASEIDWRASYHFYVDLFIHFFQQVKEELSLTWYFTDHFLKRFHFSHYNHSFFQFVVETFGKLWFQFVTVADLCFFIYLVLLTGTCISNRDCECVFHFLTCVGVTLQPTRFIICILNCFSSGLKGKLNSFLQKASTFLTSTKFEK